MKKSVRLLTLLLAMFSVMLLFAACKGKEDPAETQPPGETAPPLDLDEDGYQNDTIPEGTDFGREVVKVLTYESKAHLLFSDGYTEDEVNNTLFKRQSALEERLNFTFDIVDNVPGEWVDMETWLTVGRKCGENEIDLIGTFALWPSVLAAEGLLCNLNNLDFPDRDMPWWPDAVGDWEQSGALYYIAENSSIPTTNSMMVALVNEQMITDRGMESPIQLALEGTWYMDTMLTYAMNFASDDMDAATKTFGLSVHDTPVLDSMLAATGYKALLNDEDGNAKMQILQQSTKDKITTFIGKLAPVFESGNVSVGQRNALMESKRTAMHITSLYYIQFLEDLSYAPVPLPKLDENQDRYYTIQDNSWDMWCVPVSARNPQMSATVLEGLASADYRTTAPYYFDKYIKLRYAEDEINTQMFELIRASLTYDLGRVITTDSFVGWVTYGAWRNTFIVSDSNGYTNVIHAEISEGTYTYYIDANKTAATEALNDILRNYRKYYNNGKQS